MLLYFHLGMVKFCLLPQIHADNLVILNYLPKLIHMNTYRYYLCLSKVHSKSYIIDDK